MLKTLTGHTNGICGVAFTPDGKYVVSGGYDKTVIVWDVNSGAKVKSWKTDALINALSVSPDGKYVAIGDSKYKLSLWDINSAECEKILASATGSVFRIDFSRDSKYIASISSDNKAVVYDRINYSPKILSGHTDYVMAVCFSPDGKYLATGGDDNMVFIK